MKTKYVIIVLLLLVVVAFGSGWYISKTKHDSKLKTILAQPAKVDTLIISHIVVQDSIVYRDVPGELRIVQDTTLVFSDEWLDEIEIDKPSEFVIEELKIASVDTTLKDYGKLKIDYIFPPVNKFNLWFKPFPLVTEGMVVTREVYIPQITHKTSWKDRLIYTGIGILGGMVINQVR